MGGKLSPCLANDIFIIQVGFQPKTPIDPSADASTCFCQHPWVRSGVLSSGNKPRGPLGRVGRIASGSKEQSSLFVRGWFDLQHERAVRDLYVQGSDITLFRP